MFSVLRDFRRLAEAVQDLADALQTLLKFYREAGPALDRIGALELARHQFEAECEGMLLKADGKLKAASNAEARERQLKRSYERDVDPFPEAGEKTEEAGRAILPDHAAAGEIERLHALRLGVAANSKAAAVSAKWAQ